MSLTSFVGWQAELAEIQRLLGSTRLLTLTGIGGIGKTRLALEDSPPWRGVLHDPTVRSTRNSLMAPCQPVGALGSASGRADVDLLALGAETLTRVVIHVAAGNVGSLA